MRVPYVKSFDVIGHVFLADIYCVPCSANLPETDREGNPKTAIFADNDFDPKINHCGSCLTRMEDW